MSTTEEAFRENAIQEEPIQEEPIQYDEGYGPGEIGVGPHPLPWPLGERYDAELLAEGDRRNVVDQYRYWTREAIIADLDTRRHGFHLDPHPRREHARPSVLTSRMLGERLYGP